MNIVSSRWGEERKTHVQQIRNNNREIGMVGTGTLCAMYRQRESSAHVNHVKTNESTIDRTLNLPSHLQSIFRYVHFDLLFFSQLRPFRTGLSMPAGTTSQQPLHQPPPERGRTAVAAALCQ